MHHHSLKLVTIVTESVLTDSLVGILKSLGATGYTVTNVRGEGSRGLRVGEMPGDNRNLEVLTSPALADQILALLADRYFPNYAMVAWVSDVSVVRGEKYEPRL
jgi:nitrogen regulatory protein P-II 2